MYYALIQVIRTDMSLAHLPPELLRLILNGSNSWAAIELWKAGDRTLSAKLVNYGVTDVELIDNRPDSTSRWPTCLTCFKLERLSITRLDGPFYPPGALSRQLQQLHRGLKTLQLYILDIEAVLLGPPIQDPDSNFDPNISYLEPSSGFETHTKKQKTQDDCDDSQHHQLAWNFGTTWPLLERFELGSSQTPPIISHCLKYGSRSLTLLPPSLTWLGLPCCELSVDIGSLPPQLQTLHVPSDPCYGLSYLPTTVTDLILRPSDSVLCELLKTPQILPNLKRFPIADLRYLEMPNFLHAIKLGIPLPTYMTSLGICTKDYPGAFSKLPAALTSLKLTHDLRGFNGRPKIYCNDIMVLPRGLTYLDIEMIDWTDFSVSAWPSTLATLIIRGLPFSFDWFRVLPRRISSFSAFNASDDAEPKLDPDYAALCTTGQASLHSELALWASMKHEMLKMSPSAKLEAVNAYIKSVESGRLYGLPLTLTHLNIPRIQLSDESLLVLPPKLSKLDITESWSATNHQLFGAFSPTSPAAHVTVQSTTSNGIFAGEEPPSQRPLFNFSTLTWLTLRRPIFTPCTAELFKYLPRNLLKLEILDHISGQRYPWTTHSEALKDLPQNLEHFAFWGVLSDHNLVLKWVSILPKALKTLIMPRQSINGLYFNDLPPKLEALHCSFYDVKISQLLDLPRTLASLSVYRSLKSDSTSYLSVFCRDAWQSLISAFRPFWRVWEAGLVGLQVELTIASKKWSKPQVEEHSGHSDLHQSSPPFEDSSDDLLISNDLNDDAVDQPYDYASADVTKYLLASEEDSFLVDPRASRRISRYL